MEGFIQGVIDAVYALGNWLLELAQSALDAVFTIIKNAFIWAFDGLLGVAASALSAVSFSIPTISTYWAQVPADIISILSLVGFAECMAIISTAILVRFSMQLIPFVRLGS